MKTIGVLIVTHNRPRSLRRLVEQIAYGLCPCDRPPERHPCHHRLDCALLVVANDPCDETRAYLCGEHSGDFQVIVREPGIGYAGAVGLGLGYARDRGWRKILILTDDIEIAPLSIELMARFLDERERVAIVGPTIYDNDYWRQRDGFPDCRSKIWSAGGYVSGVTGLPRRYPLAWRDDREVEVVCGCCWMLDVDKIGHCFWLFKERYGFYMEEADFCATVRSQGFEVYCVRGALAFHDVSRAALCDRLKARYFSRNNQWYCHVWLSRRALIINRWFYRLLAALLFLVGRRDAAVGLVEGLRDFQAGKFGMIREDSRPITRLVEKLRKETL